MNTNSDTKNLPPKKLKSFRFFSKNLQPKTPPHRRAGYNPASSAGKLQPLSYLFPPKKLQAKKLLQSGFTLVELLVTLSLFVVLTTIVLFSQQKFNGSILLTNLAYDVALTVRQAQTYGVNVRENVNETDYEKKFKRPYGVHFETDADKRKFLLFADSGGGSGGNGKYDGGDTEVNKYSIKRGNYISDIRIINSDTGCSSTDGGCSVNKLDITFLRPDPDARFESSPTKQNITEAKIILSSANGDNRNVLVNSTGQISIGRGSGTTCSTTITNPMTFNYTGSEQCYKVPEGKTSITITAYGAQGTSGGAGGSASGGWGGQGGKMKGDFSVSGGDVLYVYVGGSNGYNGGGTGVSNGGSGGGASDVRKGSIKIIVGGGGGGGGGADGNRTGGNGGNGGGYTGARGGDGQTFSGGTSYGGDGGTDSYGGSGNLGGSSGLGGNAQIERSGGGGGGHFGGGAGNRTGTSAGAGGGGGSSFIDPSGTNTSTQTGANSGNGKVEITAY